MEWFWLFVLVPAILVPVVLQWGYSGCGKFLDASLPPTTDPLELKAVDTRLGVVTLTWVSPDPMIAGFQLFRGAEAAPFPTTPFRTVGAGVLTVDDGPLAEGATFFYEVKAVDGAGNVLRQSFRVAVTTFKSVFSGVTTTVGTDQPNLLGICIVTRIPAVGNPPPQPWKQTRLTVRGSTAGGLTIDRLTISQPAEVDPAIPAATREAWDSHADLKVVASNVVLAAGTNRTLPVEYGVDPNRDLLIAFDISATADQANVRFGPIDNAAPPRSYFKRPAAPGGPAVAQAGNLNRDSDYLPSPAHYIVERIEVV